MDPLDPNRCVDLTHSPNGFHQCILEVNHPNFHEIELTDRPST